MPLGWCISVHRQSGDKSKPATSKCACDGRIAIWQTGLDGLDWIDALKAAGSAHFLAFNGGYPLEYTAQGKDVLPTIIAGPPLAEKVWRRDPWDILLPHYLGRTDINLNLAALCAPHEWLYIEAWDQS
ncbi:hypothetical protein [Hyphomicrobium sp. DY-1]|uniref:hypothetical protein n=1 Tax=Hyphomicrobium sp. DY-1 TaxID=3075650 RepID=UPI0039C01CDA